MEVWILCILGLVMAIGSVYDIKYQRIPIWLLGGGALLLGALVLIDGEAFSPIHILGLVPGLVIGVVGCLCKAVGTGDSVLILLVGYVLGIWNLCVILCTTFALLMVVAGVLVLVKKIGRKSKLPFYPFALVGYLLLLCSMGGVL